MLNSSWRKLSINFLSKFRSHNKDRITRDFYPATEHLFQEGGDSITDTNIFYSACKNWHETHSSKRTSHSFSVIKLRYFTTDHLGGAIKCLISCKNVKYKCEEANSPLIHGDSRSSTYLIIIKLDKNNDILAAQPWFQLLAKMKLIYSSHWHCEKQLKAILPTFGFCRVS